jgi:very-short-patch-repair endonuclease
LGEGGNLHTIQVMTKKRPPLNALKRARTLRRDMTEAEKELWVLLRQIEGFKFRRQVPIGPYIVDFVCHLA